MKTQPETQNPTDPEKQGSQSQLNSPKLDEKTGKPTQRAVANAKQAHSICKAIYDRAKEGRISTAGVILEKYNGASPYLSKDLRATGQDWRNNFSTNFLASIIDRVKPQLLDPIMNAPMLTRSTLPDYVQDSSKKSRIFGNAITQTIRGWSGWHDFCSMLAQENVLFGVATPAWIDKEDWRPRLFRFDEAYLPEGTGQHAAKVQVAPFTQSILLHDFIRLIDDKDVATIAGYNVAGCIKAANAAGSMSDKEINAMTEQDNLREGGQLSDTYANNQTRMVELYHLLVREYNGKIDLWTVTQKEGHEVRHLEGIYDSMEEALTLFTLQTGNTKFYGSKGLGRLLCNLHIAIERGRCLAKDQEYLSGLSVLSGDSKDFNSFQPTVKHPFIMVDKNFKIEKTGVQFNANDWLLIDNKLVQLAESIAGAFIPPNIENNSGSNTKIEAAQRAERDMAVRKGVLGRFITQFYDLSGTMQRKICSKTNMKEALRVYKDNTAKEKGGVHAISRKVWKLVDGIADDLSTLFAQELEVKVADQDAVDCIVSMLVQGLQLVEIAQLALSSATPKEEIDQDGGDAATLDFISANMQNPLLNQAEAFKVSGEITMGKDRMKQLLIEEEDPTVMSIGQRQQLIELGMMQGGQPMPVAPTDFHRIHRQVIIGHFEPVMQAVATQPTPELIKAADLTIAHYVAHLQVDAFTNPEEKKQEMAQMTEWQQVSDKAKQILEAQAQRTQMEAGALPPDVNGSPTGVGADGRMVGDPGDRDKLEIEKGKAQADLTLRTHDQLLRSQQLELEQRKLDITEQDQKHRHEMERAKFEHERAKSGFEAKHKAVALATDAAQIQRDQDLADQQAEEQRLQAQADA